MPLCIMFVSWESQAVHVWSGDRVGGPGALQTSTTRLSLGALIRISKFQADCIPYPSYKRGAQKRMLENPWIAKPPKSPNPPRRIFDRLLSYERSVPGGRSFWLALLFG